MRPIEWFELAYYIFFIILTFIIVVYAVRTYYFQTKKESTLLYKLYVPNSDIGRLEQLVYLEIYNHGNIPAKNIKVYINGEKIATLDFIRPGDSTSLLIGCVRRMIEVNRVYIQDCEIQKGSDVTLSVDEGKEKKEITLNTSSLFLHSDVLHNETERIAIATEQINRTLEKAFDCHSVGPGHSTFRDELCNIRDAIQKK